MELDLSFKQWLIVIGCFVALIFMFIHPVASVIIIAVGGLAWYYSTRPASNSPASPVSENVVRVPLPPSLRNAVLDRANDTCQRCGRAGTDVHHVDENPSNNSMDNLILLCPSCHRDAGLGYPSKDRLRHMAQRPHGSVNYTE